MQIRTLHIILCVALLLTACSGDDGTPSVTPTPIPGGDQPVVFSASMATDENATTRVGFSQDIDIDKLKTANKGFGVFGCYTGLHKYVDSNVSPNFMYNEHVTWNTETNLWKYDPIKYWPNGEGETNSSINTGENKHYVSFMAYAPYSDNIDNNPIDNPAGYCIPSFSLQGEVGNPWLTYRLHENVENQVDLLYASHTDLTPILDLTKPAINEKVHFNFDHALACVGDKVNIICSKGLQNQVYGRVAGSITNARVEVTSVTIEYTLTAKARLVLWNHGEANWQTIWSEAPTCTRTVTLVSADNPDPYLKNIILYEATKGGANPMDNSTLPEQLIENMGVFYIPIDLEGYPQTAKVNITYRIGTTTTTDGSAWLYDADNEGSATLNLKDFADAYKPGKHLYINVTLNQMNIALTAAIAPWEVEDPVEMEGEETAAPRRDMNLQGQTKKSKLSTSLLNKEH